MSGARFVFASRSVVMAKATWATWAIGVAAVWMFAGTNPAAAAPGVQASSPGGATVGIGATPARPANAAKAAKAAPPPSALVARPAQEFEPNPPGSYTLPVIQPAGNGWVLDGDLVPRRLSRYTRGAVTLLGFIYTYCTDPTGCPLAYETFVDLRVRVLADVSLRRKVRFVSLSFDPTHDTPDVMRMYGGDFPASPDLRWHFLTTPSLRFLRPILDAYGQDVEVELDERGAPTRVLTHMLKVFLIDSAGQVREIYSSAYLHPDVMLNDIRTLVLEAGARPASSP